MGSYLKSAVAGFGLSLALTASLGAQCVLDQHQKLIAAGGATDDHHGSAVAASFDVVVVGSERDDDAGSNSGSVSVYRSTGGVFSLEQTLTASDGASADLFGEAVAVDGDVLVVGASQDDDAGSASGSAYVFRFGGANWVQEAKLTAGDAAGGDNFGFSVSVHGDVILVGARHDDSPLTDAGSAYLFRFDGTQWLQEKKLVAPDAAAQDYFGWSVSVENSFAVVGAWGDDDAGTQSGSAYVYFHNGSQWVYDTKLTASDAATLDFFGWSVSVDELVVVVGAWGDDDQGSSAGAAYVYRYGGSSWSEERKLLASDGAANDAFGGSIAADGRRIMVGAEGGDEGASNAGCAYLYRHNASGWVEVGKLVAADGAADDAYGRAVGIHDRSVIIGVELDDDLGSDSGSAYSYTLHDMILNAEPDAPDVGDAFTVSHCGGQPGGLVLLTVIDVDGTPMFFKVAKGTFDSLGQWTFGATVPPGLSGVSVTLFAFGTFRPGRLGGSNFAVVDFQ